MLVYILRFRCIHERLTDNNLAFLFGCAALSGFNRGTQHKRANAVQNNHEKHCEPEANTGPIARLTTGALIKELLLTLPAGGGPSAGGR
jgi:hypothetical protein